MFKRTPKADNRVNEVLDKIQLEMDTVGPRSPEYYKLLKYFQEVVALQAANARKKITPDTMALVAGNLFGILIIVLAEKHHVLGSKGLAFILKSKP